MATVAYEYGHDVSETDYQYDYNMEYGYETQENNANSDQNMEYGETDYGYGETDYGYGETSTEYGYECQTDSYGYEPQADPYGYDTASSNMNDEAPPAEPAKPEPKARRPRRRCSVTKYSLEETAQSGSAEAEMVKNLHAAEMLQKFRQGL